MILGHPTLPRPRPRPGASLSVKLLLLTVAFFMLSEVLILVPSVAMFRRDYLRMILGEAHLAALALEATPNNMVSPNLATKLLQRVGAHGIVLHRPDNTTLMLDSPMPPKVDATFDLRNVMLPTLIADAARTLTRGDNRVLRVLDVSPKEKGVVVEALIDEAPVRRALLNIAERVLTVSMITSLIASVLLYISLQWLVVRRMRRLTQSMMAFRDNPEDAAIIAPSAARDEIGLAQRELARMQKTVLGALRQNERLVALGTTVTKISHDLRNILSTVRLMSDGLAGIEVPEVKRVLPGLIAAIDRAVALCVGTLGYTREGAAPLNLQAFPLQPLVQELAPVIENGVQGDPHKLIDQVPADLAVRADRDQLFRVLLNLARNAIESGANCVTISAHNGNNRVVIDVADDGPGLPPKARDNLFRPFAGSARPGGMGLGLAIAREIARAHGGDIALGHSGAQGTLFQLSLPA
ncbi:MAG TPA: HAMP domain-containing sensor histidine kinase [Stellaceae bacterium]|nr:HAMP domain-containing sensor histidine kinase [Stellaceae bacterium]